MIKSNKTAMAIAVASLFSTGVMATGVAGQNTVNETSYGNNTVNITDQVGHTLKSTIHQGVSGTPNNGNLAKAKQTGTIHTSVIKQTGANNKVGGVFNPVAHSNTTKSQYYSDGVIQNGTRHKSDIVQSLGGNTATVDQNNVGTTDAVGNISDIDQVGGNSQAYLVQTGDSHDSLIEQAGGSNYAKASQTGGDNNDSDIHQDGSDWAQVTQTGGDNISEISQSGLDKATVTQTGNSNKSYINQLSASAKDIAVVLQNGSYNYSKIKQSGGNKVDVNQQNDWNKATVIQESNNFADIDQSSDSGTSVLINEITLTQGSYYNAVASQSGGNNNSITISQTGTGNIGGTDLTLLDYSKAQQVGSGNIAIINQAPSSP